MRESPSPSATTGTLIYCLFSINDLLVPYMTAYVDVDDPFLIHPTHELAVYAPPQSFNMNTYSPSRDYNKIYFPVIKSFTILDTPSPKPKTTRLLSWKWFKSYKPPLTPRFLRLFPLNIVRVHLPERSEDKSFIWPFDRLHSPSCRLSTLPSLALWWSGSPSRLFILACALSC